MTVLLLFLAAVLSLAVAAFCAGAETGFLSVRRGRILHMAREGGQRAKILHAALADLGQTTTALLIGNNLASVTYSSASAALVALLAADAPLAASVLPVVSALTLLFLGEFLPKLLSAARPLRRLLGIAPYWRIFAGVFVPMAFLVQRLIERMLPPQETKTNITPETVLKILEDRKDGVKLSDLESALIGRIMVLRAKGEAVTPEALLEVVDSADL